MMIDRQSGHPEGLILTDAGGGRARLRPSSVDGMAADLDVWHLDSEAAPGVGLWRPALTLTADALTALAKHAGMLAVLCDTARVVADRLDRLDRLDRAPDVRPHVPHDAPAGDPRLHLITDGVSACGVPATAPGRHGTHDPAEADCRDCLTALQQAGDEAGLPPLDAPPPGLVQRAADGAAHGDLSAAEELARAMHPSAFVAELHEEPPTPPDLPAGRYTRTAVPRGWDKIEGVTPGEEAIRYSLSGGLIDVTPAVIAYADENHLRRWQCRHCALGRVMGPYAAITVHEEGADCADHEAHCEHNPNRDPGSLVEETRRG